MSPLSLRRVFVAGTDTDIGKTLVAGILARAWNAHYWKPIQAGTDPGTDSKTLADWIDPSFILPETFVLQAPRSPNQAAAMEDTTLDEQHIQLPRETGPLVVEGAGGLMVPINDHFMMIDLIQELALPVILVARTGLGTLNHSLLSIEALRARGLEPAGLILNGPPHPNNQRDLEHFGKVPILGQVPQLEQIEPELFPQIYSNWQGFHD